METNDEFWEMMTCSSDSVLEDQEIIDTRLLSDIPAFEDVTEDSKLSPERDQIRQCRPSTGKPRRNWSSSAVDKHPVPCLTKGAALNEWLELIFDYG